MTGITMSARSRSLGPVVNLANYTVQGYSSSFTNPSPPPLFIRFAGNAHFWLMNDGSVSGFGDDQEEDAGVVTPGDNFSVPNGWLSAGGTPSNYEVECVVVSGSLNVASDPDGSGVWSNLGTTREWYITQTLAASKTAVITLTIRNATTLAVLDSGTITLQMN